jgi:hypothetical protein
MQKTATETRYLKAKAALEKAKAEMDAAKRELLGRRGIRTGAIEADEYEAWECLTLELAALKIAHYAKRDARYDSKALDKLAEQIPEILEAKRTKYRSEVRITVKAA